MRAARTILAVLLGYLVWLGVLLAGGVLFGSAVGRHPHTSQLMLIGEVVIFLAGIAAGAVAAAVATARPLLHAVVLGVAIMCALMLVAAFAKHAPPPGIPGWYPYAAALLTAAGAFVGGSLASRPKRAP